MNQTKFDYNKLNTLAEQNSSKYQNAKPCQHIYFDNFLSEDLARELLNNFPKVDSDVWNKDYKDQYQYKMACEDATKFPAEIRETLKEFNSSEFINFLEKLTGIEGIIPDPHYRGGGMHQIKVHVDFNWYPRLHIERRINVLLYLNDNWKEEYGGHFELWNKDMTKAEVKVLPIFNRLAIFSTSEDSFHGHPDPINCPEDMTRKSLALYYYTSPAKDIEARAEAHSTIFKERPGEELKNEQKSFFERVLNKVKNKIK